MKQLRTFFIAVVLVLGFASTANAQSKVAHIASQELVAMMPQYKSAMADLERLQKTYDAEIKNMMTEFQASYATIEQAAKAGTQTEEETQKQLVQLQTQEQSIAQYRQNALKDLQQKEVELLKPVIESARVAVQKVARAKGYEYVLDSTTGTGIIMADGYDLMNDVKAELGIQ